MRSLTIQKKRSQFDLLTFAGHTFGSTEELPPPPLCLDQVGPWVGKDQVGPWVGKDQVGPCVGKDQFNVS